MSGVRAERRLEETLETGSETAAEPAETEPLLFERRNSRRRSGRRARARTALLQVVGRRGGIIQPVSVSASPASRVRLQDLRLAPGATSLGQPNETKRDFMFCEGQIETDCQRGRGCRTRGSEADVVPDSPCVRSALICDEHQSDAHWATAENPAPFNLASPECAREWCASRAPLWCRCARGLFATCARIIITQARSAAAA